MGDLLKLIWWAVVGLFRSGVSLEAEILTLRHQLNWRPYVRPLTIEFGRIICSSTASAERWRNKVALVVVALRSDMRAFLSRCPSERVGTHDLV
jgi:hypothetical protein